MAAPILSIRNLYLAFGNKQILNNAEMHVLENDRICLVGRNGSGKSTLLRILSGEIQPDKGEIFIQPGIKIHYLQQEPEIPEGMTAHDYLVGKIVDDDEIYKLYMALDTVQLNGDTNTGNLSGGEKRRLALAEALMLEPDLLLMDEPTNHLDLPAIESLENELKAFKGAFIIISHDRRFLENTCNTTLWLDRTIIKRMNKNYSFFEEWSSDILEIEAKEQHKMDKFISSEAEWSVQGISGRRKRNQGRLARLYDLRKQRSEQIKVAGTVKMSLEEPSESGKIVAKVRNISKSFEDRTIIKDFSTIIKKGDKIGIIGPNGCGKSTLIKLLTGQLEPDSGKIQIGTNLDTVYIDQNRSELIPDKSLWQNLCNDGDDRINVQGKSRHIVGYLKDFLFEENQMRGPVSKLSGGEMNRLLLAKNLAKPCNYLILDEPTNDLDMDTLDLLQETLSNFNGTILIVSHDRDFLDKIVTSLIVFEGDGVLKEYAGGYSDYLAQRGNVSKTIEKATEKKVVVDTKPKEKNKLSFKHKHLLETLPTIISELDVKIAKIENELSNPKLYTDNPNKFDSLSADLIKLKHEKEALEHQWLEVEMIKEEFES